MVPASERSVKSNVWLACSSFFLLCLSAYVIMPLIPLYLQSRATVTELAWITVGASVVGVIPASIIGGRISDYIGRKVTIALSLLIFGFSKFFFPYAETIALLFVLRAIGGLYAAAFPSTQSILASAATTPEERTKFLSYYGFAFGAGLAIGPMIGGYVGQRWDLSEAFNATLYFSLLGVLLILFVKEEKVKQKKQKLLVFSKNPLFWRASLSAFLCMGAMGMLLTLLPLILNIELGLSKTGVGFSMAVLTGCFAISQLVVGPKLNPAGLQIAIVKGFSIMVVGLVGLFFFHQQVLLFLMSMVVVGIGLGTAYVAATSMAASTTTIENRGGIMGLFTAAMNLGYGILAVLVVYLSSIWRREDAFLILTVIALVVVIFLMITAMPVMQKKGTRHHEK